MGGGRVPVGHLETRNGAGVPPRRRSVPSVQVWPVRPEVVISYCTVNDLVSDAVDESPAYTSISPGSTTNLPLLS
jgi:hypothetical protein